MTVLAVFLGHDVALTPALGHYLSRVDAVLDEFGARIIAQAQPLATLEGESPQFVTIVEFPTDDDARRWYASSAYQAIRGQRQESGAWTGFVLPHAPPGHRASDLLPPEA